MDKIDEITYDPEVDAAYISLTSEKGDNITTLSLENRSILLDFDADNRLVGIESIDASNNLPKELFEDFDNYE